MPMATSDSLGPALGNPDGGMAPAPGGPPPGGDPNAGVPCPACQGSGMVPPEQAEAIEAALGGGMEGMEGMEGAPPGGPEMGAPPPDMASLGGPPPGPESSPVTGQSIQDYDQNRPERFKHQPLDHGAVASEGKRVRERMRSGGHLGRA